jgi:exopolysaccharide biosynthesis protein
MPLGLNGVNVARGSNGIVLYTPTYAASTRTPAGGYEVVVTADSRAALNRTINVRLGSAGTRSDTSIPSNGFVLSAAPGSAATRLRAFWTEGKLHSDRLIALTLRLQTSAPVSHTIGGHPVILTNGKPLPPPAPNDKASLVREPRTLVGWNAAGDVWLVTIDGRQRGYSVGATFWEAADVLRQLGATDGINLDGGGSTTFVAKRCAGSLCVRNRPSDGRQRGVTTALAVIPRR